MKQNILCLLGIAFFAKDAYARPVDEATALQTEIIEMEPFVISVIVNGKLERTINIGLRLLVPVENSSEIRYNISTARDIINREFYQFFPNEISKGNLAIDLDKPRFRLLRKLNKELGVQIKDLFIRYFYAR